MAKNKKKNDKIKTVNLDDLDQNDKREGKVIVSAQLPISLEAKLRKMAKDRDISLSHLIRFILQKAI